MHPRTCILALAILSSCTNDTPVDSAKAYLAFCEEFRDASCDRLVACGTADRETCESRLACDGGWLQAAARLDEGALRYDAINAARCMNEARRDECSAYGTTADCWEILGGRVSAGGTCQAQMECSPGTYCAMTDGCTGTCRRFGREGDACGGASGPCELGLWCGEGSICTRPAGRGDACTPSAMGLPAGQAGQLPEPEGPPPCDPMFDCVEGRCEERPPGQPCGETRCDYPREHCLYAENRCVPPGEEGEPCNDLALAAEMFSCVEGLTCDRGTCKRPLPSGAACASEDLCMRGEYCLDGVCRPPAGPGGACDPELRGGCRGLPDIEPYRWRSAFMRCDEETLTCTLPKADGESCDSDFECESVCVEGTCTRTRCGQ